ncbi:MAG: single-stranded-DNA-specific exonuclease RecJ, partial [Oscillospiraceae bacterium]
RKAVENGEKMVVYGDYDVDGVSATALMVTYLESIGGEVFYKLPSRSDEGYGLSKNIIKSLAQKNIKLIITVDNGVSAIEEIDYANEMGVDVVVTDHHLPKETLPNAIAVVDPLRKDDNSGAKILSGVGVAYMAMCAIEQCSAEEMLEYYADLVAIGTIADIMQLTGINRKIVQKGLQLLQNTERAGLAALFQKCGFTGKKITGENISYAVSPRLNAAGRMDNAAIALNLLLEEDYDTAVELAEKIESYNALRQTTEQKIAEELTAQIQSDPQLISSEVLVVWGKGYHAGVIGIVASRLVERFNKPSIVFTIDENGEAKGSGRSFEGFSLYNAINACSSLCLRFGGHDLAAGLTVMENDLLQFRKNINSWAIENYPVLLRRPLCADATVKIADLTIEEVESLDLLAPFGQGNVSPVFMVENALIDTIYPLSQGK